MEMEEILDNDNNLIKLIRENGLLTTSPGFTQRVMQMVEVAAERPVHLYKPLLSRKAWILISASVVLLLLFCWWAVSGNNPAEAATYKTIQPAIDLLRSIDFSVSFNKGAWLIATIAVACMGILLMLDIRLSHKYRTPA